jgi:hypothetical protein
LPFESRVRLVMRTIIAILLALLELLVARDFVVALTPAAVIAVITCQIYIRSRR